MYNGSIENNKEIDRWQKNIIVNFAAALGTMLVILQTRELAGG
jgi:hypothetical protein